MSRMGVVQVAIKTTNLIMRHHKLHAILFVLIVWLGVVGILHLCSPDPAAVCADKASDSRFRRKILDESVPAIGDTARTTYLLLILILTAPGATDRREMIRSTWLSHQVSDVTHYFVVGTRGLARAQHAALQRESLNNDGDLLLLPDLVDSYVNLTRKVSAMYAWADANLAFQFALKCDDDSFIRVEEVAAELRARVHSFPAGAQRFYWGFFDGRSRVYRRGKWAEPAWSLCDRYLPHALGGGYVLSADLVRYVAANRDLLQHYRSEDVSVGAWLAPLRITRRHDPRFDTEYRSRGCNNAYIVTHKQSIEDMRVKHTQLVTRGTLCERERRDRLSFVYNWTALPSECCKRVDPSVP